ncbi:hypothetical protein ACFVVJ_11785 [Streptomyces albidoflavus]
MTAAVAETQRVLGPHTDADWSVPAGPLEWSCRDTAVHIAHDLLAYATQLAARPTDAYLPLDLTVRPEAAPAAPPGPGRLAAREVMRGGGGERANRPHRLNWPEQGHAA